jgi:hypothetical protein
MLDLARAYLAAAYEPMNYDRRFEIADIARRFCALEKEQASRNGRPADAKYTRIPLILKSVPYGKLTPRYIIISVVRCGES